MFYKSSYSIFVLYEFLAEYDRQNCYETQKIHSIRNRENNAKRVFRVQTRINTNTCKKYIQHKATAAEAVSIQL